MASRTWRKMMTKDALNERRQALEDEFFHRVD